MKTISNEEKARELAKKICWDSWGVAEKTSYEEYYDAAMQMAAWKDEQFEKVLEDTYDLRKKVCRSDTSFADCTELIKQLKLKLKEE